MRIEYIQIDNNTDYVTSYPVIFTPSKPSKLTKLNRSHLIMAID